MESQGLMESHICIQSFLSMLVSVFTVLGLMESYARLIEGVRVEGTLGA